MYALQCGGVVCAYEGQCTVYRIHHIDQHGRLQCQSHLRGETHLQLSCSLPDLSAPQVSRAAFAVEQIQLSITRYGISSSHCQSTANLAKHGQVEGLSRQQVLPKHSGTSTAELATHISMSWSGCSCLGTGHTQATCQEGCERGEGGGGGSPWGCLPFTCSPGIPLPCPYSRSRTVASLNSG